MQIYIVEVESGSCEQGGAMIFDSAWSTLEQAQSYCKKFKGMGGFNHGWDYTISEYFLDSGA